MMPEFMRTLSLLLLDLALLYSSSACTFDGNRQASSALGEAPPATPKMIEFATDLGMAWNPGFQKGMWRTEVDDNRASGKVHIIAEAQCPDRYRVVVTGTESSEQIFIDKTMYERKSGGPWAVRPMQIEHMMLRQCGKSGPPPEDPARMRLLAEQFSGTEITGPELREINGHQCREWTRKLQNFNAPLLLVSCYDIKTHATLRVKYGEQVTTYDYDTKVSIKPPI